MRSCKALAVFTAFFSLGVNAGAQSQQPAEESAYSVWKSKGYGYILEVHKSEMKLYDITDKHCLLNPEVSAEYQASNLIELGGKTLFDWQALHPVELTRLASLPKLCQSNKTQDRTAASLLDTFDVFWQTFAEHFAFNDKVDVNWQQDYSHWREQLSKKPSEQALARVMHNILIKLGDGHAYVETPEGRLIAQHNIKERLFFKERIAAPFALQTQFSRPYEFHMDLMQRSQRAVASYLEQNQGQRLFRSFFFASLPGKVRYLSIDDLSEFNDGASLEQDLVVIEQLMAQIMPELQQSEGLVLDLRWNSGGYDVVSKKLLSYFIGKPLHVGSKQTKLLNGFDRAKPIVIKPAPGNNYLGPIVVLTSPMTISAAEVFTLGLAARDKVSIIGEASNGAYSDILEKKLPNGWLLGLSNERYLAADGNNYEYSGYPVEKTFTYLDIKDLEKSVDPAIEEAIKRLN